ncbi:hypothetical protein V6R21_32155 [Limibacter armeniacum]|uniref:DUF6962 family protein n=1 Tax=Limibacter armeniacum TaxID=466084 RepID=UPI002FE634E0
MELIQTPTAQTTAATDLLLGLLSLFFSYSIYKMKAKDKGKATIWAAAFLLLSIGALVGSVRAGFVLSDATKFALNQPFYLSLALTVALFVIGLFYDLTNGHITKTHVLSILGIGAFFYILTVIFSGMFFIFLGYAAVAMLLALFAYSVFAVSGKVKGASMVASGILLTLTAFAIQASKAISFHLIWDFDHNGTFHLVQILGTTCIFIGISISLQKTDNTKTIA